MTPLTPFFRLLSAFFPLQPPPPPSRIPDKLDRVIYIICHDPELRQKKMWGKEEGEQSWMAK